MINVERFVPPENVYHEIFGRMRKRHDFEMVDWKVSDGMWYALQYEPRYLELERDRDLQSWSLFLLAWISALVGMVNDS